MLHTNVTQQFLDYLSDRDFDGLATVIAPGARARLLLPRGPEERNGRDEIVTRIKGWFGSASHFEIMSTSDEPIGSRRRLSWRLRVVRESGSPEVIEQLAMMDVGPEGIDSMDLLCSGFAPEQAALASCDVAVFDAGNLGCADGLAQEFRRRIESVPVGVSLAVIVADPAAKVDLPPLARMLGHSVKSTHVGDDGRLTVNVERQK